jgi:hypothetical protein
MAGNTFSGIPAGYQPAYGTTLQFFKVTVTNAATRLKDLITTAGGTWPTIPDDTFNTNLMTEPATNLRMPQHVFFQVPIAAANPVYLTWDNNTAPVVGGPGMELETGTIYKFENAWNGRLLSVLGNAGGKYNVDPKSAFQFIAAANTTLLVFFSD